MDAYYLDTSALVKYYVAEPGTNWVRNLVDNPPRPFIHIGLLTGPELIAALFRKARTGEISRPHAEFLTQQFRGRWEQKYDVMTIASPTIDLAMTLVEQHGLRGYDAVHLAIALEVQRDRQARQLPDLTFVSADVHQLQVAAALGLPSDNPDQHL